MSGPSDMPRLNYYFAEMFIYIANLISGNGSTSRIWQIRLLLFSIILIAKPQVLVAQEPQPTIEIVTLQNLSFGAFSHGAMGGTVTINSAGSRSATGDIVLLNIGYSFSTASYKIYADPFTVISLLKGPNVTLTGSNGGSLTLQIGDSYPASPFLTTAVPPATNLITIGGTLIVGNLIANPQGNYNGTFDITFVQE